MSAQNFPCNPPEILAPAGDQEALLAAIKGGADAVYLGVGEFNARQGAKNFTLNELENAVDLAHSHGVSVYLALNIPIKQKELKHALEIVDRAYAVGIDAIILQDLGLLRLLKQIYPDLELHTSTQMTIHNRNGVDFVAGLGAKRVIVSRELTANEVRAIVEHSKANTASKADIEVFVHGALCYSYSGKCLFSSFLHDRSANRGACAQPCRRRYKFLVNGRELEEKHIGGSYPISCAELSTLTGLEEIVKTGVVSLKIEGRMKKPEYVTASAAAYKAAVETICKQCEDCTPEKSNKPEESCKRWESTIREELESREAELAKLFYRGFTKGFILGEKGVSHPKYSSNYGAFLGKVLDISRSKGNTKLTVRLDEDIQVKDGISVFTRERMLGSAVTGIVTIAGEHVKSAKKGEKVGLEISSKTGRAVQKGDELYLTTDTQLLDTLQKTKLKTLPVSLKVKAREGEPFTVEIREEGRKSSRRERNASEVFADKTSVEFADEYIVQGAEKAPTTKEQIEKAMESLGGTPFEAASIAIEADENIFIPVGVLKNARRKAADFLLEKILRRYKKDQKYPLLENFNELCAPEKCAIEASRRGSITSKKLLLSVEVNGISSLFEAAGEGADIIYIPISKFEEMTAPENAEKHAEKLENLKVERIELVFKPPLITHDSELDELKPLMEKIRDAGFSIACSDMGAAQLAGDLAVPFAAQKEFNIFNAFTASTFYHSVAFRVTLSSELNLSEIKNICEALQTCGEEGQTEILVYGRELMLITENDLLKPLIDRKIVRSESEVFLVDQEGSEFPVKRLGSRTLIYNSKVLDMLKYVKNLRGYGVNVIRLDLSLNNVIEIKEIVRVYKDAIEGKEGKLSTRGVEYTTGHYFKGV
jgi:U32 family peptidase